VGWAWRILPRTKRQAEAAVHEIPERSAAAPESRKNVIAERITDRPAHRDRLKAVFAVE
jgi:hypothetical protein